MDEIHDDAECDLDESWILEQERIQNIQNNYCREPMENIQLCFIYINPKNYIDKVLFENYEFDDVGSQLSKEYLLKLVQTKRTGPIHKYRLIDTLLYNVDLEPENIQSFSKMPVVREHSSGFFKIIPILDTIRIPPSIFIFHKINTLYFIFQQIDDGVGGEHRHTLKSILKTSASPKNSTKKVHIVDSLPVVSRSRKTTIKRRLPT